MSELCNLLKMKQKKSSEFNVLLSYQLSSGNKRVYYCQRCLNHDRLEPRKNHKCDCMYATCTCNKCILVEKRRVLNTQLHDLEEISDVDKTENDEEFSLTGCKGERVPNCQKCGQHGRKSRLKGHKRVCPYKDCKCPKCQVVSERQKLMADQIKIRRRQRKDTLMNFTRKKITDTLNAAAVVAASNPMPYLNGFNALLYKQLQQNMQHHTGLLACTSPNESSSTDSSSYSPTNSIGYLASSPSDAQNSKATTSATPTMSSQAMPVTTQLPLLFSPTAVMTQPGSLPSTSPASTTSSSSITVATVTTEASLPSTATVPVLPQIAVPIAINPLLAGCSMPTIFTDRQNSTPSSLTDKLATNSATTTTTTTTTAPTAALNFGLPGFFNNKNIIETFLANMQILEQKICAGMTHEDTSNTVIDVCSI
uniref:DM domain-containing protein n=1 Tax=Syphacia muris TaxID=451379 RepID=A0A0N5AJN1_9BILA